MLLQLRCQLFFQKVIWRFSDVHTRMTLCLSIANPIKGVSCVRAFIRRERRRVDAAASLAPSSPSSINAPLWHISLPTRSFGLLADGISQGAWRRKVSASRPLYTDARSRLPHQPFSLFRLPNKLRHSYLHPLSIHPAAEPPPLYAGCEMQTHTRCDRHPPEGGAG